MARWKADDGRVPPPRFLPPSTLPPSSPLLFLFLLFLLHLLHPLVSPAPGWQCTVFNIFTRIQLVAVSEEGFSCSKTLINEPSFHPFVPFSPLHPSFFSGSFPPSVATVESDADDPRSRPSFAHASPPASSSPSVPQLSTLWDTRSIDIRSPSTLRGGRRRGEFSHGNKIYPEEIGPRR